MMEVKNMIEPTRHKSGLLVLRKSGTNLYIGKRKNHLVFTTVIKDFVHFKTPDDLFDFMNNVLYKKFIQK